MNPFNPLKPLTREELTDEDITFLNAVRVGIIPFSQWSRDRNATISASTAHEIMDLISWGELSLEDKRIAVEKTFQIAFAVRQAFNQAAEAAGFQDNQAKAKKIKIQNDEKGKKLVDEAIASRDSNGTLKHKSSGRTRLDDFQKAVKMLLDMNVGGRKIVMPEAAIISTIKASHPDVSDEKISETITLLKSRNATK